MPCWVHVITNAEILIVHLNIQFVFQVKDYSQEEIQDSLLQLKYRNKSVSPFISKGTGQFEVYVYGEGNGSISVFYNDTLKADVSFNLKSEEGECCNSTPLRIKTEKIIKI